MSFAVCIFEDSYKNFLPLTYTRPVFDLLFGALTLREKIIRLFPRASIILHARDYLGDILEEENPGLSFKKIQADKVIFINGRALLDKKNAEIISNSQPGVVFFDNDFLVGAVLKKESLAQLSGKKAEDILPKLTKIKKQLKVEKLNFIWDLIAKNGEEIKKDFKNYFSSKDNRIPSGVKIFNQKSVFLGKSLNLGQFTVIDAREGPVIIEDEVETGAFTVIKGPVFVGKKTIVKPNSYIYGGTSIGPFCKVAGEISASIIQGYSNKQHEGYLGHSFLGEWVNLGAGTITSDLKNNYSSVKVLFNGKKVDTGLMFLGAIIGDHTKTAIGTLLNTGTIIGNFVNVFEKQLPKEIPSFSWGGASKEKFELSKAIKLADIVMKRRNRKFTPAYKKLITYLYRIS